MGTCSSTRVVHTLRRIPRLFGVVPLNSEAYFKRRPRLLFLFANGGSSASHVITASGIRIVANDSDVIALARTTQNLRWNQNLQSGVIAARERRRSEQLKSAIVNRIARDPAVCDKRTLSLYRGTPVLLYKVVYMAYLRAWLHISLSQLD